jgi:hypothetical protein
MEFIVSSGMPRSASTLLYNILREILIARHTQACVSAVWDEDPNFQVNTKVLLVKTHVLRKIHLQKATHIFYSFRDVRVSLLSNFRMFGEEPSIAFVRKYIHEWQKAQEYADMSFPYDTLTKQTASVIERIAFYLQIPVIVESILSHIESYSHSASKIPPPTETMLHPNHRTFTNDEEWKTQLDLSLQKQIHREFSWWFHENGYPI